MRLSLVNYKVSAELIESWGLSAVRDGYSSGLANKKRVHKVKLVDPSTRREREK